MGNNFLSVCKGVNGGDSNNENADQNQQLMKETEKRKQERRIKVNRLAPASVHSTLDGQGGGDSQQGKMSNYPNSIDGSSQSGIEGFKGNSQKNTMMISRDVGSIEGSVEVQQMKQNNRNSINNNNNQNSSQEGSPTKIVDPSPLNKNKKPYDQVELLQSVKKIPNGGITTAGNGLSDVAREEQLVNDKGEEEGMLKNNNDKYFTKEDLAYYEQIRHNTEKKTVVHRDKNIRWQPGEVLGSGSFGQVILGMNIDTGEFMAVKQISIGGYNQADRKEKVQQIQSEIETLQNFSDKHIVRYIGIKKSENSINIFLEYVPGGSISSLLYRYNKFNETLIRKFTTQILKGLEYLHSNEIIHRDIKGANVLVDKDGNCKLADFGSAKKIVEEKGHNDSIRGTPYWMAPETIKQVGSGRFADIWSIGCTVIEMATAKPPWADKTPIQAMFYIANATEAPPIPEHLSAECKDFVSKCLRIRPRERYNVRQLLNHSFISGVKNMNINQPSKFLTRITEETTFEGQTTSSPGRGKKDCPNRMESRGNTLFREENSMTETKVLSIKSKTFQSNNIHKNSDSDKSIDSLDHHKHSLRQISNSNSRKIHTRHLTSGSTEREDNSRDRQQNQDSQVQSTTNNLKKSSNNNSSFSSSSSSSSSSDENKQTRQITSKSLKTNKSQASNKRSSHAGSQQWSSEGQNEKESIYGGIHEVSQTNIKSTQPLLSLFSGRQSFGKHHTVNNMSTDNNDYDDNAIDNSTNNNNTTTNQQLTGRNQQIMTNTSINFKDNTTAKRQEKEGSVNTFKTTNFKQQGNLLRIQQDQYYDRDNEEEDEMSHVRLVSRGSEGKITKKIGDIRDLDSSPGGREGGNDESEEEFIKQKQQGQGQGRNSKESKNSQKLVQVDTDEEEEEEKKDKQEDKNKGKNGTLKMAAGQDGKISRQLQQQKQQQSAGGQNGHHLAEEEKKEEIPTKEHRQLLSQQQGIMDHSQHHIRAQSLSQQTSYEEFEFDQGAVDQIIKHQTTLAEQNQPIRRIKTSRQKFFKQSSQQSQQQQQQQQQQSEDHGDDRDSSAYGKVESLAGTEKFGRFRHNGPTSPKLLTQISNGPSINGCSLDHILLESTKQGCLPTSESFLPLKTLNTVHNNNQFTQYFNQDHATSNSINGIWQEQQHHQQTGNGTNNSNYRQQQQSSIDQNMLAQFMDARNEKQQ